MLDGDYVKTIGLLAGMSWESSVYYYTVINTLINEKLGGYSSAKIIMNSIDFDPIEKLQKQDNWNKLDKIMVEECLKIEKAGADVLIICTNTMHISYSAIQKSVSIPIIHIADATGEAIKKTGIKKIGLLGTIYTMEKDFYKERLVKKFDLDVIVPEKSDMIKINEIIFKELVFGKINSESKQLFIKIINDLITKGAQGIILGCTEIPLLIKQEDITVQIFDTTYIHAEKAVEFALKV